MNGPFLKNLPSAALLLVLAGVLAGCTTTGGVYNPGRDAGASPHYKVGKPYKVRGRWYYPEEDADYEAVGVASWYGRDFHGKRTANGETFDMNLLSAAHTTLPMPSLVEVTNLKNGRRIVVRVNDRGPFADNRLIDLSRAAARRLGFEREGLTRVKVRFVGPAPLMAKAPRTSPRIASAPPVRRPPTAKSSPAIQATPVRYEQGIRVVDGTRDAAYKITPPETRALPEAPEMIEVVEENNSEGASPPEVETAKTENGGLYLIRIAALSQLGNIEALKAELEEIGPLRLTRIESAEGQAIYRVNMGPFASLEAANERLEAVRDAGYSDAGLITLTP